MIHHFLGEKVAHLLWYFKFVGGPAGGESFQQDNFNHTRQVQIRDLGLRGCVRSCLQSPVIRKIDAEVVIIGNLRRYGGDDLVQVWRHGSGA